ncbi:hypothetical protein FRB96_007031 [Tulasnella sp. 330]|nr:hypothetical protein FRB96_007031 [Tulasnella sp. 330]
MAVPNLALQIIEISQAVETNNRTTRDFAVYIRRLGDATLWPFGSMGGQPINTRRRSQTLREVVDDMRKLTSRSPRKTTVSYGDDPMKVAAFMKRAQNSIEVIKIYEKQRLIEILGAGESAGADKGNSEKHICFEGTREASLAKVHELIDHSAFEGKHIMWLTGVAGFRKSCVAEAIEKQATASNQLGGGFHFALVNPGRNKRAILEISRQLALRNEGHLRDSIATAVKEEPNIAYLSIEVLDGLDEFEEPYATKLLQRIGRDHTSLSASIKFLITSRAEHHIRSELGSSLVNLTVEHLILDVEYPAAVGMGITVYPKDQLAQVTKNRLAPLDVGTLASLLPYEPGSKPTTSKIVRTKILLSLEAVLKFPDGDEPRSRQPVEFLHQSFVDFLITGDQRLFLNVTQHHEHMATACFLSMADLTRGICRPEPPPTLDSEVGDILEREDVSPALRYACPYREYHPFKALEENEERIEIDSSLKVFALASHTTDMNPLNLVLLHDARRFIMEPINTSSFPVYFPSASSLLLSVLLPFYEYLLDIGSKILNGRSSEWATGMGYKHSWSIICVFLLLDCKVNATVSLDQTSIFGIWRLESLSQSY